MTSLQVTLLVAALLGLTSCQVFNGYINPLFLPRGLRDSYRRGRVYSDPYGYSDLRDNGYYLSSRGLPGSYLDYDVYRRLPASPRYDDYRRYSNLYGNLRRYPSGLDRRYNDFSRQYQDDIRYQPSEGLATTARPLDRERLLDREVLDRGQVLGTPSPQLDVAIQPNGSA